MKPRSLSRSTCTQALRRPVCEFSEPYLTRIACSAGREYSFPAGITQNAQNFAAEERGVPILLHQQRRFLLHGVLRLSTGERQNA